MNRKAILLILDGWGLGKIPDSDAIAQAETPIMDELMRTRPNSTLTTFGEAVGLPSGQMGNSEVGHMNIGAGRPIYQDLLLINRSITSGTFKVKPELVEMFKYAKKKGSKVHFIGLLSDGGVHSHISHLKALIDMAEEFGMKKVFVHGFTDGRDTDPHGGVRYLADLQDYIKEKAAKLATLTGRYYAMDRDQRWERVKLAYDAMVCGIGESTLDTVATLRARYKAGETDEFIMPIIADADGLIEPGDTVLFFNYRADRPRQLTSMLAIEDYAVGTKALPLDFYSMTPYSDAFQGKVSVIYDKKPLERTFGELIQENGLTQLRMAETEKYPHVTYFFSGGREEVFVGERRILVNSPKVATYDLKPSMSAVELTDAVLQDMAVHDTDFICLNFANTDMVGHTGDFAAAMEAAETVDRCVGRIIEVALIKDYQILIIADHGNSDFMINEDGSPNTAHSLNPVPCIYIGDDSVILLNDGVLADVAPTLADMMGIKIFEEMDGKSLISRCES